jgi:hypothetical protein
MWHGALQLLPHAPSAAASLLFFQKAARMEEL